MDKRIVIAIVIAVSVAAICGGQKVALRRMSAPEGDVSEHVRENLAAWEKLHGVKRVDVDMDGRDVTVFVDASGHIVDHPGFDPPAATTSTLAAN